VDAGEDREPELCGTCCGYGVACSCGDADCAVSWYDPAHVQEPCPDCDGLNARRPEDSPAAGKPREPGAAPGSEAARPTAAELWGRVQSAEKAARAALDEYEGFGVLDPTSEGSPEYEEAHRAVGWAWVRAEEARHELDAFLNPKRYAKKGYRAEALDEFRAQAEISDLDPEIE
jgi:hypothetical protein